MTRGKTIFSWIHKRLHSIIYLFPKHKKGKVKKPQADPFILKGLTGGG